MSNSSKSRNFRRRGEDDGDLVDHEGNPTKPPTASRKQASSKPKKLLSFVDDEEDEDSQLFSSKTSQKQRGNKSTKSSHKLTALKDRLSSSTTNVINNTSTNTSTSTSTNTNTNINVLLPQAGTYTKEALLELQKNTRTLAKPSSSEPKIKLKGLLKPTHETLIRPDDLNTSDSLGESNDCSVIPDEHTIQRIRAKRERLRQSRAAAPDYISLDGGGGGGGGVVSNISSSDAFSDDEEPELRTPVALIGKTDAHPVFQHFDNDHDASAAATTAYVIAEEGNAAVLDEDDEEDKIWEEEQFRKALGKRMDDASTANTIFRPSVGSIHNSLPFNHNNNPSIGGVLASTQSADALSIPEQSVIARKALLQNLAKLKETHSRTVSSLSKADENLSASLMNITALEKSLSSAGEKFIFMQKLRDFVSVICEFLQHKAPYIEELEEQMQKLHEQRAISNFERRTGDNEDEMIEVKAAIEAAKKVFSAHGSSEAVITAAMSAAQDASAAMIEQNNLPVKLDEFGRDINQQKRMDMKRRAEARQRRKAQFESMRLSSMEVDGSDQKIEGESSTDESDSESAAYQSNRDLLLMTADQIFNDASDDYSQLSVVKERFENWKNEYSASYRDAYMPLSAPAIFSPYVRLELLKWDPLHEDAGFFHMKWHSLLSDYGLPQDGSDLSPEDADANLVPELVEKVAIPILHHEISHCWDMLSTRETKNAVFATNLMTDYVPASSEALGELLVAIRTRLTDAVANIMVPAWSPPELKAVPSAARVAAYRFGMSVRLMRNICLWKDILSLPVLEKLVLDELLCGKVLPHLQSIASNVHDAVTRTERVIASLSGVWTGSSVTTNRSYKLQPLVDCVMLLGKRLKDKRAFETEASGLARRLKKMLVELNDYDKAREIARMFSLREAL